MYEHMAFSNMCHTSQNRVVLHAFSTRPTIILSTGVADLSTCYFLVHCNPFAILTCGDVGTVRGDNPGTQCLYRSHCLSVSPLLAL